jgi:hypothetical protein
LDKDALMRNEDLLGLEPPRVDAHAPVVGTIPPAALLPPTLGASDSYTADHDMWVLAGRTGGQQFIGGAASPVAIGDNLYRPQYAPLSKVAFAPYEIAHRTWTNLFHPQPVTADRTPRPDWNPFRMLRNWPMQAAAGLRYTVFGGPQTPSPRGRAT